MFCCIVAVFAIAKGHETIAEKYPKYCPLARYLPDRNEAILCNFSGGIESWTTLHANGSHDIFEIYLENFLTKQPEYEFSNTQQSNLCEWNTRDNTVDCNLKLDSEVELYWKKYPDVKITINWRDGVLMVLGWEV